MKSKFAVGLFLAVSASAIAAPITPINLASSYSQDFNTLASSGTSSTTPVGWVFSESGTSANTTYAAGTGSDNAGNTYSFGAAGSSDRALGGLQSGSLIPTFGVAFQNRLGANIASFSISYTGEQWRLGARNREDRLNFQYSVDASSLATGTWTDFDSLDFIVPSTSATIGALNGNETPNQTSVTATISSLAIAPDSIFWLRWSDFNPSGSDDGLAIDDFSITAQIASAPSTSSVPETLPVGFSALALLGTVISGRIKIQSAS